MRLLSRHFSTDEFSKDAPVPDDCVDVLRQLCVEVLEPVRDKFMSALLITSGYRSIAANEAAHGQVNSEHIYSKDWAAADFLVCSEQVTARAVFDWMRSNKTLPFHQLILEHSVTSDIIHVSVNRLIPGLRSVLEGAVHNHIPYVKVQYVQFEPKETSNV